MSPPPLHQEGNQTEAEPSFRSLSWFPAGYETFISYVCGTHQHASKKQFLTEFPAASFTDPCNATEPPANAVIGPPDDMVCEGVRKDAIIVF